MFVCIPVSLVEIIPLVLVNYPKLVLVNYPKLNQPSIYLIL